jgi:hypothetical protein
MSLERIGCTINFIIGVVITDRLPAFIPPFMKAEIEREIQTAVRLPIKGRLRNSAPTAAKHQIGFA